MTTRDGKTKTTIDDEYKDHIGVHRNRPKYLQTYVVHDYDEIKSLQTHRMQTSFSYKPNYYSMCHQVSY